MASEKKKLAGPNLAEGVLASEFPDGGIISGHVGDDAVLLARPPDGIFAIGARCTHYGGPLGKGILSGDTVRCPWHHACFSLRTGEAIRAPAIDPVARWCVQVVGDRIFVREKLPAKERVVESASSSPNDRFVIIGGGAAGFAAAEFLRRKGFDGELTLFSDDDVPPVDRPNLSKDFLAGKAPEDWVLIKPSRFYEAPVSSWNCERACPRSMPNEKR